MSRYVVRIARQAGIAALFVIVAILGSLSGVVFAYVGDLPQISALDDYAPSTITRVHASSGDVIGEFAVQRRVVIGYDDMAPQLREAIIAAEDAEFNRHFGLSMSRIVIALMRDIMERRAAQGASTLTQQLARNLFLTPEKSIERKIKEALLALQIEKRYTKREIFTLYCNQIYLGHGAYGVEAASRLYFGKSAKDLNLEEAAVIAGTIQIPERLSPFVDMERALRRRTYVLNRMVAEGYITPEVAEDAKQTPIVLRDEPSDVRSIAPYFVEEVRQHLEEKYGAKRLYEAGLSVQTTLDIRLQEAANRALDEGLRRLDKRRGYREPSRNVIEEGGSVAEFQHERWGRRLTEGAIVPAVVTSVDDASAAVRIGSRTATLDRESVKWTNRTPASLFTVGDLVDVRIHEIDDTGQIARATLDQTPLVEGALVAIDNDTGHILAMVGGYSFDRSKFNRATQALRQLGSTFKPVLYAAAIDRGYTPTTILDDEPSSFTAGPNQPPYTPTNYDGTYEGPITLRHALEKSRNIPAVQVMEQLGPEEVANYSRRFGFTSPLPPVLSLALGAGEATLLETTSAYSVFPNQGVRLRPFSILRVADRDGNVLEENRPEPVNAIRADTAYVMTSLLRGVVQRGTAARAASIDWPLAGKTGTVDDFTDAWFVGFDPDITVGVWVGHDEKKSIGYGEDGARAALPIWIDFMSAYIEGRKDTPEFSPPGNIVFLSVDRYTGAVTDPWSDGAITESFIAGTQPGVGFPGR